MRKQIIFSWAQKIQFGRSIYIFDFKINKVLFDKTSCNDSKDYTEL